MGRTKNNLRLVGNELWMDHGVGIVAQPRIDLVGEGRCAYLWVGDGTRCLFTMSYTEVQRLLEYLAERID